MKNPTKIDLHIVSYLGIQISENVETVLQKITIQETDYPKSKYLISH